MRIVNGAIRNLAGAPIEARIALRAPHKVAAVNLADTDTALGARLGFLCNESCRFYLGRITSMSWRITDRTLEIVAFRTRVKIAKAAFPGGAKESLASFSGARLDERRGCFLLFIFGLRGFAWHWHANAAVALHDPIDIA